MSAIISYMNIKNSTLGPDLEAKELINKILLLYR